MTSQSALKKQRSLADIIVRSISKSSNSSSSKSSFNHQSVNNKKEVCTIYVDNRPASTHQKISSSKRVVVSSTSSSAQSSPSKPLLTSNDYYSNNIYTNLDTNEKSVVEKSKYYSGDSKYRLNLEGIAVNSVATNDFEQDDENCFPQPPSQSYLKMVSLRATAAAGNFSVLIYIKKNKKIYFLNL